MISKTLQILVVSLVLNAFPAAGNAMQWVCSGLTCEPIPTDGGTIAWAGVSDDGFIVPVEIPRGCIRC